MTSQPDGRQSSFEEFYTDTYPSLVRALTVSLSSVDQAHDSADEAMTRAYVKWPGLLEFTNPQGWCYRVGLNHGRSVFRKLSRKPQPVLAHPVEHDLPFPELWQSVRSLHEGQRDVLVCRALYQLSVVETAALLKVSEGTVKSRYARALAHLRESLVAEPNDDAGVTNARP